MYIYIYTCIETECGRLKSRMKHPNNVIEASESQRVTLKRHGRSVRAMAKKGGNDETLLREELKVERQIQNPCWLIMTGVDTTQYIGDYNNMY